MLLADPRVLLLDVPTANIDQRLEGEIADLLESPNQGITILAVCHDVALVSL